MKTTDHRGEPIREFDPEQLGDMGLVWRKNLAVVLDQDLPQEDRLEALHCIDRLFDGPLTPPEDLESVVAELEANL